MVQMKDAFFVFLYTFLYILYIPHGSDESTAQEEKNDEKISLYIPHGSDERLLDTF